MIRQVIVICGDIHIILQNIFYEHIRKEKEKRKMPPTTAAYKKGGFAKIDNSIVQTESRIEKARIRIMKWHFT